MTHDPIQRLTEGAHGDGADSLPELVEVLASWCGVLDTRAADLERLWERERVQGRRALDCAAKYERRAEKAEHLLMLVAIWADQESGRLPEEYRDSIDRLLEKRR